ncbi:hypothetical protein NIES2101_00120 [Calothrix sp. HK-06]|nr:hypothetical protein NIES2101_00120 [Calothrix sp. HK-06]
MSKNNWNPQYKTLDCWRGVAALWVMIFHGFISYNQHVHFIIQPLANFAAQGILGVNIFFVISGYCMAASVYKLTQKNGTITDFIKNRIWRIYPTYWVAFGLTVIINVISSLFTNATIASSLLPSWHSWVGHLLLIQTYLGIPDYLIVYWTLVIEVAFYFTIAALLLIRKYFNQKFAIFAGLVLGFACVFTPLDTRFTFLRFWCDFVCGYLVFSALFAKHQKKRQQQQISIFLIVVMGLLGVWMNWNLQQSYLWFSAMFALLLYILHGIDSKIYSLSQLNWLKFIGVMSYSLYLMHVPLQLRVLVLGLKFIPIDSPLFLALQILGWVVAITGAFIFYRLVEVPVNDWRYQRKKIKSIV